MNGSPILASSPGRFSNPRSIVALMTVLISALLLVTACSSGSSKGSSKNSAGGGGGKTITYWSPPQNGQSESGTKAILAPLIAKFKQQTGITVNVQVVDWSTLLSKLTAAIASGTGPDVAGGGNTWNGIYTSTGGVVSWTPAMMKAIGGTGQFIPSFLKVMGYPGKDPISIPEGGGTWQMVYNKKLLAAAGIKTLPTTWPEFITDAQKTTNSKAGVWGTASDVANVSNMSTWEWILMRQFGGDVFDAKGKASANLSANVDAMKFFVDWIGKDKIMSPQDSSYNASQAEQNFDNGKVAFLFTQGASSVTLPASQYGAALIPMTSAAPPASQAVMSHIAGENVIILKSSKNQDADVQWVKFLLSPAVNVTKNAANGSIPTVKGAENSPKFNSAIDKIDIKIVNKYADPQPINSDDGPLYQSIARSIGQLFGQAATGSTVTQGNVQSALNTVQTTALAREAGQK